MDFPRATLDLLKRAEGKLLKENVSTFCYNLPRTIQVETTSRCNLSCLTCFRHQRNIRKDMTLSNFTTFIEDVGFIKSVYPFGGGEPLLHPQFDEIINLASKHANFVGISTNGMLLDKEKVERLNTSKLDELTISLDSPDAKEFAKIRIGGDLDKVLSNTEFFSSHSHIKLRIHVVLSNLNIKNALMLPELASKLGAEKLTVNILHPANKKHLSLMPEVEIASKTLTKIAQKCRDSKLKTNVESMLGTPPETTFCKAPLFNCFVDSEGYMTPCCNYPMFRLSNVFREGFESCWNSPQMRSFRKTVLTGNFPEWCQTYCITPRQLLANIHRHLKVGEVKT